MDIAVAFNAVLGFVGFFFVLYLALVVWPRLAVDYARQQLFELRDGLFDLAAKGDISFDSESYRNIRAFLNSMIRNAERMSAWNCIRYAAVFKNYRLDVDGFIATMNGEGCHKAIRSAYASSQKTCDLLLVLRNPLLLLVGIFLFFVGYVLVYLYNPMPKRVFQNLKRRNENAVNANIVSELRGEGLVSA